MTAYEKIKARNEKYDAMTEREKLEERIKKYDRCIARHAWKVKDIRELLLANFDSCSTRAATLSHGECRSIEYGGTLIVKASFAISRLRRKAIEELNELNMVDGLPPMISSFTFDNEERGSGS